MTARTIPLTQGKVAIVDTDDYEALSAHKWRANYTPSTFYAVREQSVGGVRRVFLMHRVLMAPAPGLYVDHINHDGLDNRRANLRVCTNAENQRNGRSRAGSSSKFLGVYWSAARSRWGAQIKIGGQTHGLGRYLDETEAARAYDAAAREHHGQFANPNFPQGV